MPRLRRIVSKGIVRRPRRGFDETASRRASRCDSATGDITVWSDDDSRAIRVGRSRSKRDAPKNSDVGAVHLALHVEDIGTAIDAITDRNDVTVLDEP